MTSLGPVRDAVYATLAAEGRAPSVEELCGLTSRGPAEVAAELDRLRDQHALVLTTAGDAVRMAHPFSAAPMGFVVMPVDGRDERRWWGGCAWDSFGISAALGLDVLVDTVCPACAEHVRIEAGPRTPPPAGTVVRIPRPAAQWWDDVVATCSSIRLFCSADHAADWQDRTHTDGGRLVPAETMWRLSGPWYGDRLAPSYEPHARSHNQQLLEDHGLTGDFWRLP